MLFDFRQWFVAILVAFSITSNAQCLLSFFHEVYLLQRWMLKHQATHLFKTAMICTYYSFVPDYLYLAFFGGLFTPIYYSLFRVHLKLPILRYLLQAELDPPLIHDTITTLNNYTFCALIILWSPLHLQFPQGSWHGRIMLVEGMNQLVSALIKWTPCFLITDSTPIWQYLLQILSKLGYFPFYSC